MVWRSRLLAATLLGLGSSATGAQIFVCTDARGRTISADRPPVECGDRTIRELRADGSVRRLIEPPLTEAQKTARIEEEKQRKAEAEVRRQQMRRDLALLEAYASEQEIEQARDRQLANRQTLIERAQKRKADLERDRKKLDVEAEFYARREMPERLKLSYETHAQLLRSEDKIIGDIQADIERLNERFDTELKRYRELIATGTTPRSLTESAQRDLAAAAKGAAPR